MEGSLVDLVSSNVAVARSAEVHWTGLSSLDTWLPNHWETGVTFDFPEGHTTVWRKCPLDVYVPLTCRSLSVRTFPFAVNELISMDEARTRISGSDGVPD